ncbi:hypothetical protein AY555_00485 [Haematospirillum jordaniae]|uniref:Uncharacterized protein n=1 Tax=Haematospirillum jordaniae TaxID=1549855 RepID=A0A143DB73_9PROT|nr:hypothetical protein AY555_00485 [Haematospirillum jordaniae]
MGLITPAMARGSMVQTIINRTSMAIVASDTMVTRLPANMAPGLMVVPHIHSLIMPMVITAMLLQRPTIIMRLTITMVITVTTTIMVGLSVVPRSLVSLSALLLWVLP